MVTNDLQPLIFQNVALNAVITDTSLHKVVFLEDCVATVSETGHVIVSAMNLTSNPQRIRSNSRLETVVPVSLVYQAVPKQEDETKKTPRTIKTILGLYTKSMKTLILVLIQN